MKSSIKTITTITLILTLAVVISGGCNSLSNSDIKFDGQRAYQDVEHQVSLGPRIPDSVAHTQTVSWMTTELEKNYWDTEVQESFQMGHKIQNVIGRRGMGSPWVILGAHYDSRIYADRDPDIANHAKPVPGANDGASGVAVLLELARVIPQDWQGQIWAGQIWLVFFDGEDNGSIPGWDWILGSRAFVEQLTGKPDYVVIVDMIGDADLNVFMERRSNQELTNAIWARAADLGYSDKIIPEYKYQILDDHIPFIQAGIPAIDIIDFDYPYWHTTEDTLDKVSADSLRVIGETLLEWLMQPLR